MHMVCSGEEKKEEHFRTKHHDLVESKFPWCEASQQELLSFALRASEQTQNEKEVVDTMLFRCQQEVQAAFNRHTPLLLSSHLSDSLCLAHNPPASIGYGGFSSR